MKKIITILMFITIKKLWIYFKAKLSMFCKLLCFVNC